MARRGKAVVAREANQPEVVEAIEVESPQAFADLAAGRNARGVIMLD